MSLATKVQTTNPGGMVAVVSVDDQLLRRRGGTMTMKYFGEIKIRIMMGGGSRGGKKEYLNYKIGQHTSYG
jgi:hypothetical protein